MAERRYKELHEAFPESKKANQGLIKVATRLKETKTGEYDRLGLFEKSQKDPHLDLADVVLPNLEVKEYKGRGRGLLVTKDVKAGQLLMMKPFASSSWKDLKMGTSLMGLNLHNDSIEKPNKGNLNAAIAERNVAF